MITFQVLSSSELFHHDHLVLTHFRSDLEEPIFLLLLSQINDVGPALLILRLEILQELVERLVPMSQLLNGLVQ